MPNDKGQMTTDAAEHPYDLGERTALFGEAVITFAVKLPRNAVTTPVIRQLVRSATSVGANVCEANDAVSRKDFRNKIGIAKKEANETKYWPRMVATAAAEHADTARELWQEAKELHLILCSSFNTASKPKIEDEDADVS